MLVFGTKPETIPVKIARDASTDLPLLSEEDAIMQMLQAYLALPYSVTEYGCGKKASLIINRLLLHNIPAYAIMRGMILERDMSPEALAETDFTLRPHALVCENPLSDLANLSEPALLHMMDTTCPGVEIKGNVAHAGPFPLSHSSHVQFVTARSHIYTIVLFWDSERSRVVERVIDPGLNKDNFFPERMVREHLRGSEAWLLRAPLLGHFRLQSDLLTEDQRRLVREQIGETNLADLSLEQHAELLRTLTGAERGSIGDPDYWTYANNISSGEETMDQERSRNTGRGEDFRQFTQRLIHARENRTHEVPDLYATLRSIASQADVQTTARAEAEWSEQQLQPLANFAMTLVYYWSLGRIAEEIRTGVRLSGEMNNTAFLDSFRGLGVRLRWRIDLLGDVSEEDDGRIDARALSRGFVRATLETIRQMNQAGLTVCLDSVGNIHGLLLDQETASLFRSGEIALEDLRIEQCVAHGSHIDTVNDAGKFDGRLGVLAGLETAHALVDLERYHNIPISDPSDSKRAHMLVTAYIGEEMTFTGQGVSMPGSAAIAGRAEPDRIYGMQNGAGERFGDLMLEMLRVVKHAQEDDRFRVVNNLEDAQSDAELIDACYDPTRFYTRHTFERHIEQGPVLDRAGIPIALVGTIMGIYQEDFVFVGDMAEAAALDFNRRMRSIAMEEAFRGIRLTVGIIEGRGEPTPFENVAAALRWTLDGELNHAGATATEDRRDPGVAAGRLAAEFLRLLKQEDPNLEGVIGNVQITPGTNRNVIPGQAAFSVAVKSRNVSERVAETIESAMQAYAFGTLARAVGNGGEGVRVCRMDRISFINVFREARASIDLRADSQETIDAFFVRLHEAVAEVERDFAVEIQRDVQQKLPPFSLEDSGQVLLMERSYGGSHNPNETELLVDLVRGCVLQLGIMFDVLGKHEGLDDDYRLFRLVDENIPDVWKGKLARFTSGALHDTCNIAARAIELDSLRGRA